MKYIKYLMTQIDPKFLEVETSVLKERIKNWREEYVDHINQNIAVHSLLDQRVVAHFIDGQRNDTQILMQWCEVLAHKIEKLENEKLLPTPIQPQNIIKNQMGEG